MSFNKSIIIKPAGADCNLDCEYCFYLKKSKLYPEVKKHRMSIEVLEEFIKQVMQSSGRQVGFIWQGGEPTLMGIDFFNKVVEFQMKYGKGQTVSNAFQTNGILLNDDWAKLFYNYKFLIGLSVDGEASVHDHFRRTVGGGPTFEKMWENMNILRRFNVDFNVLGMVNSESAKCPESIYNFFLRNDLNYMQFIPTLEIDDKGEITDFSVSPGKYGEFLCRLFDVWYDDIWRNKADPYIYIRDFDSIMHKMIHGNSTVCIYDNQCGQHVVVEHNGDVYACDFFVEPEWKYGNLMETPIHELVLIDKCEEFTNRKMDLMNECRDCKWLDFCYNGCPKFRGVVKDEPENKFYYCESYKTFFDYSFPKLRKIAQMIIDIQRTANRENSVLTVEKAGRNEPCPCGSGKKYKHCCRA